MDKTEIERKIEDSLKEEREKLLSEVRDAILMKKAMMVDTEEIPYRKRRY